VDGSVALAQLDGLAVRVRSVRDTSYDSGRRDSRRHLNSSRARVKVRRFRGEIAPGVGEIDLKHVYANHVDCTDAIARYLVRNVPGQWKRIEALIEVEHDIEMVTSELIYRREGKSEPEWFTIEDGEEDMEFGDCFVQLARLLSTPGQGLFKKCRFAVNPDGRYRAEYEY
jgi:hypothetical protein